MVLQRNFFGFHPEERFLELSREDDDGEKAYEEHEGDAAEHLRHAGLGERFGIGRRNAGDDSAYLPAVMKDRRKGADGLAEGADRNGDVFLPAQSAALISPLDVQADLRGIGVREALAVVVKNDDELHAGSKPHLLGVTLDAFEPFRSERRTRHPVLQL